MARSSLKNSLTWCLLLIPAACSGKVDSEDPPFEGTTEQGGSNGTTGPNSTGGRSASGGNAATGATQGSGGNEQNGGAGETGKAGDSGLGGDKGDGDEWPPADGLPEGTLDELLDSDCQIALDNDDDGEADQRWGYEYGPDAELVNEWMWDGQDDLVTKTLFNSKGLPTASCTSEECEQFVYSKKSGGGYTAEVLLHSLGEPPDLTGLSSWDVYALESEKHATWTFDSEGRLKEVRAYFLAGDVSHDLEMRGVGFSLMPDGKFSDFWAWEEHDFENWSRAASFYPSGSLKYYAQFGNEECSEIGWTVSRLCDSECEHNWKTDYTTQNNRVVAATSQFWDGGDEGYGGMPGPNFATIESTMEYSEDGLSVVVKNSFDDGSPDASREQLLDPERSHVERDSRGNITVRRSNFQVDRSWGLVEQYTYSGSGACRSGSNPHLQKRPHVRIQPNEEPRTTCKLSALW